MARMYSRKHGKSGSTKPNRDGAPEWFNRSKDEVEKIVVKLADEGKDPAEIGIILRDQYGVPSVKDVTGKKMTEILEENNKTGKLPEDLRNLVDRAEEIRAHLEEHNNDSSAVHGLEQIESKIRRLKKYYKENDEIPQDWDYNPGEGFTVKWEE